MTMPSLMRDERVEAVENSSFRWGYLVLSFGLLLSTAYRSVVHDQQSWDLLALVLVGGLVVTGYQALHRILTRRWWMMSSLALLTATLIAFVLVMLRPNT